MTEGLRPGDSLQGGIDSIGLKNTKIGLSFDKSYILGDEINAGSYGTVYYTHHVSSTVEDQYAVKIIERDPYGEAENEALQESKMMLMLKDIPNVIQLRDFYMDKNSLYIVQDLAMGGDVFDRLAQREQYTEKDARELAKMLLVTMKNVHSRNIVHRDLKPENLLLQNEKNDSEIYLCDFGLAKKLPEDEDEGFTTLCGTPAYTSPEILSGEEPYREKGDLWAVGVIIFVLLGGALPFGDDGDPDLYDRIEDCDFDFDDDAWDVVSGSAKKLIKKLLEYNPKKRWTSEQALESRWFKQDGKALKGVKLQKSLLKIKGIVMRRKLKGAVQAVRLSSILSSFRLSKQNIDRQSSKNL